MTAPRSDMAAAGRGLARLLAAEAAGTAFLLATVVGSGLMAERLADGNLALALLGNSIPTGAMLYVLITALGPISGAHFNPAVTLALCLRRELSPALAAHYVLAQLLGATAGTLLAHGMFEVPLLQLSPAIRSGVGQWLSEGVATFGLVATVLSALRWQRGSVAAMVGLYITAAYWFTASTSFANPAVTLARSLTDSFSGIRPQDVVAFTLAQLAGAVLAAWALGWLLEVKPGKSGEPRAARPTAAGE